MSASVLRLRDGATSWSTVESETVLLDLDAQSYVGLNEVATLVWSMLAIGATREALVEEVCNRFSVSADDAAKDVAEFLAECQRRGYLDGEL